MPKPCHLRQLRGTMHFQSFQPQETDLKFAQAATVREPVQTYPDRVLLPAIIMRELVANRGRIVITTLPPRSLLNKHNRSNQCSRSSKPNARLWITNRTLRTKL